MGPSLTGGMWGSGASANKAFSGRNRFLPEVEHVWSWFPPPASTSTAPVPREQEAPETLLGPRASRDQVDKAESAAFMSKHALGLSLVSQGEFHIRECSTQKLLLCLF